MSICARGFSRLVVLPLRSLTGCRFTSSKQMAENPGMGCCSVGSSQACSKKEEKKKGKAKEEKIPPECIENPCCPDPPISYDEEFKDQLVFKQRTEFKPTWVECPPRRIVQKVACGAPEPEPDCKEEKKLECPPAPQSECEKQDSKCPKITMPGCKPAMVHNGRCKNFEVPSDCEKIKAPYPCYSECAKPKPKPLHPTECGCLDMRSMCEVYMYLRKKGIKDAKKAKKKL